jgi:hypothetical protein
VTLTLEDLLGHFIRTETDESTALDDPKLDEAQAMRRISQAQDRKAVYLSRISHKEREKTPCGAPTIPPFLAATASWMS